MNFIHGSDRRYETREPELIHFITIDDYGNICCLLDSPYDHIHYKEYDSKDPFLEIWNLADRYAYFFTSKYYACNIKTTGIDPI